MPRAVDDGAQFYAQLLRLFRFTAQDCCYVAYNTRINFRDLNFQADHTLIAATTTMGRQRVALSLGG